MDSSTTNVHIRRRTRQLLDLSPWAPLRSKIFFALFIAQLVSNLGTLMQSVGAAWLIGDLGGTSAEVALVQTMTFLPAFLVGIPAGALADVFDRRKVLLWTQASMLLSAALMALLTFDRPARPDRCAGAHVHAWDRRRADDACVVGDPTRSRSQGAFRTGHIARIHDLQRRPCDRPRDRWLDHRRRRDRMGFRTQRVVLPGHDCRPRGVEAAAPRRQPIAVGDAGRGDGRRTALQRQLAQASERPDAGAVAVRRRRRDPVAASNRRARSVGVVVGGLRNPARLLRYRGHDLGRSCGRASCTSWMAMR